MIWLARRTIVPVLCCVLPVLGVAALAASGYRGGGSFLLLLLCPLGHIALMLLMCRGRE